MGSRGPRGKVGPRGRAGKSSNAHVARLAAQMEQVVKELQIQLIRIAQIQAQLDRFAAGLPPASSERGTPKRTN